MKIGSKIKELRKRRGITQEQLANSIGISFQAVSKWENNITLPDITIAPALASYFGVTMDELFDFSLTKIELAVREIADEAYKYRDSDPEESRRILEEGLINYPDNEILLNNLLYVLDYDSEADEVINIASSLIEKTSDGEILYDALRLLAHAYRAKGDFESVQAVLDEIPELYFTKLTESAYLLEGEKKIEAASKQKWISFRNLLDMMTEIALYYEKEGEFDRAVSEIDKAEKLISVLSPEDYNEYSEYFETIKNRINKS